MRFRKDYSSLVWSYETFKENSFYGVGQRRIKLFLNSLARKYRNMLDGEYADDVDVRRNWYLSIIYRTMLETENCNINAKKYRNTSSFDYSDHNYHQKHQLIRELCLLCLDYNRDFPSEKIVFGYSMSDVYNVNFIIYFELPDTGQQISFHTDLDRDIILKVSRYGSEWDGIPESTLWKLEDAICERWGSEIRKKYRKEIEVREEEERKRREAEEKLLAQQEEQRRIIREKYDMLIADANAAFAADDLDRMMEIYLSMPKKCKAEFRESKQKSYLKKFIMVNYGNDFPDVMKRISEKYGQVAYEGILSVLTDEFIKAALEKYPDFHIRQENQDVTRGSIFVASVWKYNLEHRDDSKVSMYKCSWNKCMYVNNLFGIPVGFFIDIKLSKKARKKYCLPELPKEHFEGRKMPDFLSYDKLKDLV